MDDPDHWGGKRNNPQAEEVTTQVLLHWRQRKWPVYHVKHNSTNPLSPLRAGKPGNALKPAFHPREGELLIHKEVNSAFIGTDLHEQLLSEGIHTLVVVGLTTEHCISTTVRMAGNLGFKVYLVADATAAFPKTGPDGKAFPAELVHEVELANLHGEFAQVVNAATLMQDGFFPKG